MKFRNSVIVNLTFLYSISVIKVLGLSRIASQSAVTSKWRILSRQHHPDKVVGTKETRLRAYEEFLKIQEAFEKLSNQKNRRMRKNKKSTADL